MQRTPEPRPAGLERAPHGVGRVALVGAGPGDPGLITVKGRDLLAEADVVVYDRLAHPDLLDLAPEGAERIFIGKAHGRHVLEQDELNHLLVFLASQGKKVVRLKGGDPFVYGRGGEEAEALHDAGIPFEIVPGVTSAVAAPAYAGVPITDRRYASSVAFVTGHLDPKAPDNPVDWAGLARSVDTLVIFMGLRQAGAIASALVEAGRGPDTPVAVIEWGTYEKQRSLVSSLERLADDLTAADFGSPSIIVVGEVVGLHKKLAWFEELAHSAPIGP